MRDKKISQNQSGLLRASLPMPKAIVMKIITLFRKSPLHIREKRGKRELVGGFTLIELLVVIAIISTLASVVLASVNSARSKARNAHEKSDVQQIITALELARNNNPQDKYPLSDGGGARWSCFKSSGPNCWRGFYPALPAQAVTDLAPYLPTLPKTAVSAPTTACYANDSYLYISNSPSPQGTFTFSGGSGAFLIWAKETTGAFDPGECPGYDGGSYDCGLRYCYQFIGVN